MNLSTSASVVFQPRLALMAAPATPGATPIASSTCERATLPDEQAEPDETATPSRSRLMRTVSAASPATAKHDVLGSLRARQEKISTSGDTARSLSSNRSRNASVALVLPSSAAAKPAIAGDIFRAGPSVQFLPTPDHLGRQSQSVSGNKRADPAWATKLVRRNGHEVDPELGKTDRNLAQRLHGIGVQESIVAAANLRDPTYRLDHPRLIVCQHHAHQRRKPALAQQPVEGFDINDPLAIYRERSEGPVLAPGPSQ